MITPFSPTLSSFSSTVAIAIDDSAERTFAVLQADQANALQAIVSACKSGFRGDRVRSSHRPLAPVLRSNCKITPGLSQPVSRLMSGTHLPMVSCAELHG
jgi:hypothetical protein